MIGRKDMFSFDQLRRWRALKAELAGAGPDGFTYTEPFRNKKSAYEL